MKPFWSAVAILALTATYVVLVPPRNLALGQGRLRDCPTRFGDWNGAELSFENAVVDELRADDLLLRRYVRGRDVIWLMVVYHQNSRSGAHDPLLCYDSAGYLVEPGGPARIAAGDGSAVEVSTFVAAGPRDRRLVYYWWYGGGRVSGDRAAAQREMALRGMLDNRSWGAFVRVETLAPEGHDGRAAADLRAFAKDVMEALPGLFEAPRAAGIPAPEGS